LDEVPGHGAGDIMVRVNRSFNLYILVAEMRHQSVERFFQGTLVAGLLVLGLLLARLYWLGVL